MPLGQRLITPVCERFVFVAKAVVAVAVVLWFLTIPAERAAVAARTQKSLCWLLLLDQLRPSPSVLAVPEVAARQVLLAVLAEQLLSALMFLLTVVLAEPERPVQLRVQVLSLQREMSFSVVVVVAGV
jgi:hypothetical protein